MKRVCLSVLLVCFVFSVFGKGDADVLLSTPGMSVLLKAEKGRTLLLQYVGGRLERDDVDGVYQSGNAWGMPCYPVFGKNCSSLNALQVCHGNGDWTLDLVVDSVFYTEDADFMQAVIRLCDKVYPFFVDVYYRAYKSVDMIETWVELFHRERKPVVLKRFDSGHLLFDRGDVWISHLHGNWASETFVTTEALNEGVKVIKNMDGSRNGQTDHAEVMVSLDGRPAENHGRVFGVALCWSGNYKLRIDTDSRYHRLFAGMNDEASEYVLDPKKKFVTPVMAFTYSGEGLGGVSRNFHRWARRYRLWSGESVRRILLNSWEGVYFDVNEDVMGEMMKSFSSLGGELFVMDDGWFGGKYPRNNDVSSLGDWIVDTLKLPHGIDGLIGMAKSCGIDFGIWLEPESTNAKSELIEKHPDWVLQVKGREPVYGRGGTQLLLDMCNPEVQDFAYELVDRLLRTYPEISYIKWDANADLKNYGSTYLPKDRQSHIYIEYHRGLENVLKRIRARYPSVVIQACGGGGGRVNYGILPYCNEFWVSDNTDALQRIYMQWGTSYFYPSNAMAQHVSASPNHQTGRRLPLKYRFDVAMSGRLGLEMQPSDMTSAEQAYAQQAISAYKEIRSLVQLGNLYRLSSPYENRNTASLMYVSDDKTRAVVFAYRISYLLNQPETKVRFAGLDATKNYRFREIAPDGTPCALNECLISGKLLMDKGILFPFRGEYDSFVFELIAE